MQRFRQRKTLQKFASVHSSLHNHFSQDRHLIDRKTYKQRRSAALAEWKTLMAGRPAKSAQVAQIGDKLRLD